jgi:hypothetical protein
VVGGALAGAGWMAAKKVGGGSEDKGAGPDKGA